MTRRKPGAGRGLATLGPRPARSPENPDTTAEPADSSGITPPATSGHDLLHALHSGAADTEDAGRAARIEVALDELAPHPLNPPGRTADPELTASIRSLGVIQPLTVADRSAVVADAPELDDQIPRDARWVTIAGHRRADASRAASLATVPVLVRNDLADVRTTTTIFLAENLHREELSPLDEALGYERLRDRGWSQRRIAEQVGVSQGQVSKRLRLMALPEEVRAEVAAGRIPVIDALRLLDLPEDRQLDTFRLTQERHGLSISASISQTQAQLDQERRAAATEAELRDRGVELIDPAELFGASARRHIVADEDVEDLLATGGLAGAAVSQGRAVFYATASRDANPPAPGPAESDSDSTGISAPGGPGSRRDAPKAAPQEQGELAEQALVAHRAAAQAREAVCVSLLAGSTLSPTAAADILADVLLAGLPLPPSSRWFGTATGSGRGDGRGRGTENRRQAVAAALTALEAEARKDRFADPAASWPSVITRHVKRLVELGGYAPSPHETSKLAAADRAGAEA